MAWVEALENVGLGTEDMAQWVRVPAVQSMSSSPQCPHIKKKKTLHPAWIVTPVIQTCMDCNPSDSESEDKKKPGA